MKKIIFGLGILGLMFHSSCKKDQGGLGENSWSVAAKTFDAVSVKVSTAGNYITAADGAGSTLDFSFKTLPASSREMNVNEEALNNDEIALRTVLSGNIVYTSIQEPGAYVSVRVNNGKYTLIANNIKMVNNGPKRDTVLVSTHIVEQ